MNEPEMSVQVGDLPISQAKESLSRGYVECLAAAAGCSTSSPLPDAVGVDLSLAQRVTNPTRHSQLDVQLKSTADPLPDGDVSYRLRAAHYNDLCLPPEQLAVPRILVLYFLPAERKQWIIHGESETCVRHRAYWISLMGRDPTDQETITISIPSGQLFTVETLGDLHARIREKAWP